MRFLNDNNKSRVAFTFDDLEEFCDSDYEKIKIVAGGYGLTTDYYNSADSFMSINPYYFSVIDNALCFVTKNEDARLIVYEKDMKNKEIEVNFENEEFIFYFKKETYKFECDIKTLKELEDYFDIRNLPINSAR